MDKSVRITTILSEKIKNVLISLDVYSRFYIRGPQTFSSEGHITFPSSDGGPGSGSNKNFDARRGA